MAAARAGLGLLAALSVWLCALPRWPALAAIAVVLAFTAWGLRRDATRPAVWLRIADDGGWLVLIEPGRPPRLFGQCRVQVRGSLAWVRVRGEDGRTRDWAWWPDTLAAAGLRRLRLASRGPGAHSAAALATMPG